MDALPLNLDLVALTPVLVTLVVVMLLGMLWYGPLFGKHWMRLVNLTEEDTKKGMGEAFTLGIFGNFLMIYVLSMLVSFVSFGDLSAALTYGFLLWLGLLLPAEISGIAWEKRPMELLYINAGWMLIAVLVSVGILVSWG